jgi:hypothetical protein
MSRASRAPTARLVAAAEERTGTTPMFQRASAGRPATSIPAAQARSAVGTTPVVSMPTVVDLPAPQAFFRRRFRRMEGACPRLVQAPYAWTLCRLLECRLPV